jgi:putative peptidoglycan lipid II flippase
MYEIGGKGEIQKLISGIAGAALSLLGVISIIVYFSIPNLLPYVVDESVVENMDKILQLTILSLSLLFFSGIVILGNAVLNAMGKFVTVGFVQLTVPLTAIMSVIVLADTYGVIVVMLGMVIGQLMNLTLIGINMKKVGYSLRPSFISFDSERFKQVVSQYFPLVASAFFVSIAVFVNTILAATLPEGGVSIFNLGNKFVLIVTGLIGAGISTVMLPYFSALIAKNQMVTARRELSVFLLLLTFLFVPVSVALFVWAEPIVSLLFKGGDFGSDDVVEVARVLKYAAIQIPIFAGNVLLLKFAISTKHVKAILVSALVGLLINVVASMLFMKYMGVAGIALGASLSMIAATTLLVIVLARHGHIIVLDVVTLLLNWLLFITLLISINFSSVLGIIVTVMTYIVLLVGYIKSLSSEHLPMSVEATTMMKVG